MGTIIAGRVSVKTGWHRKLRLFCCSILLVSCASTPNYAPVTDVVAYEAVIRRHAASSPSSISVRQIPQSTEENARVKRWIWPARGVIVTPYSAQSKGIDIAANAGSPVYAAASGRVVYAGNGLRGYGGIIIIKHNKQYLTIYAYNRRLFVRQGDLLKIGQKIAEMGENTHAQTRLHFEIRSYGKPINPLNYI